MELQISSAELQGGGRVKKGKLKTTFLQHKAAKKSVRMGLMSFLATKKLSFREIRVDFLVASSHEQVVVNFSFFIWIS